MLKKIFVITNLVSIYNAYCLTPEEAANVLENINAWKQLPEETREKEIKMAEQARKDATAGLYADIEKQCDQIMQDFRNHKDGIKLLTETRIRKVGKFGYEEYEAELTLEEARQQTCYKLDQILQSTAYAHQMAPEESGFNEAIEIIQKFKNEVGC